MLEKNTNLAHFKFTLQEKEEVFSTNESLKELNLKDLPNGYCLLAERQSMGKGQRGKSWEAAPGQNLTFSFLWKLKAFNANKQFGMLRVICLAMAYTIGTPTEKEVKIKWPNDLLVNKCKVAGILIENFIQGTDSHSIVGIGVNVNQNFFNSYSPPATSLSKLSSEHFNVKLVLSLFEHELGKLMEQMTKESKSYRNEYLTKLYASGEIHEFETESEGIFEAEIIGVDSLGRLILQREKQPRAYLNGEIKWVF